jgi:Methylase involved in ubiquinone/menaquinone biosynthesis
MDTKEQAAFFPATVMPDPDWWQALWPDPEGVIRALGVRPGMTVLDLCCGDGYFTAALARQVEDGRILGFDLDEQMLAAAASVCAGLENCTFLQGDAMALHRLLPEPVDYCLMANTFHGVPEQTVPGPGDRPRPEARRAFRRRQLARPSPGRNAGPGAGPRTAHGTAHDAGAARAVVEPSGLRLDRVVELPPYHYGALFRLPG